MLTGALLLGYKSKYSTTEFYKKRLIKIFIPFIIWSLIYLAWTNVTNQINPIKLPLDVIKIIISAGAFSHFWYLYIILGIYAVTPILAAIVNSDSDLPGKILICFCIIQHPVLSLVTQFWYHDNIKLAIPMTTPYILYVLLGWYITQGKIKIYKKAIYILGICGVVVASFGTYFLSVDKSEVNMFFYSSNVLPLFVYSIAIFVFFLSIKWDKIIIYPNVIKIIHKISDATFGIYIIHMIVLYYYRRLVISDMHSIRYMMTAPLVAWIISLAIILIMKRIPFVRAIV